MALTLVIENSAWLYSFHFLGASLTEATKVYTSAASLKMAIELAAGSIMSIGSYLHLDGCRNDVNMKAMKRRTDEMGKDHRLAQ